MVPASASMGFYQVLEVLRTVMAGNLFSAMHLSFGIHHHPLSFGVCFAVWFAGMVDVTGDVVTRTSINDQILVDLEKIFTPFSVCLFIRKQWAKILYNKTVSRDLVFCKKTESGLTSFHF